MGGESNVVVGVLGQWASGKSTAAKALVDHLGGRDRVIFITDRRLMAAQVIEYIRQLPQDQVTRSVDAAGFNKLEGPLMTVRLPPTETLDTVDPNNLLFDLHPDVFDRVPVGACHLLDAARLELGRQVQARLPEGRPIVVEAGFGTNVDPRGENPFCHTLGDFFQRMDETGLAPDRVKWIVIEASYITRSVRNYLRYDTVPAAEFDRFAAAGGDLSQEEQRALENRGVSLTWVSNQHNDRDRFKADIIAAYERLFAPAIAP